MEEISSIDPEVKRTDDEELLPQVRTIVNRLKNSGDKKASPWGNISVLIITIVFFLASGIINNPVADIINIIFIILIHELGHLLAMKAFGYKDVKMFFIPFFGAAVSGKHDDISPAKKAVISLAGPVPGMVIGIILGIFSVYTGSDLLYKLSVMFILLNGLNLLPLYPFDGGRFMSEMFFIRNKYFEFLFKVLAVSVFIIAAIEFEDFILALIGISLFLTIGPSYKLAVLTKELQNDNDLKFEGKLIEQNNSLLNKVVSGLINKFPNPKREDFYDKFIYDLWDRLKYIPPRVASTVGLSIIYFIFLALIVSPYLIPEDDGTAENPKSDVTYFIDKNANDGIMYYPNGKVHIISSWKNGRRDGIWSEYDEQTRLTAKYLFVNDEFVCKMKYARGRFDTLSYNELSQAEQEFILNELK